MAEGSALGEGREVKVFRVRGVMKLRGGHSERFEIEVPALKGEHAVEYVLSTLGSRHRLKRCRIVIEGVEEVPPERVKRDYIRGLLEIDRVVAI